MRLFKFELLKILGQKSVWGTLVFVLVISGLYLNDNADRQLEQELYEEWAGPLTEAKVLQATEQARLLEGQGESLSDREQIALQLYRKIIAAQAVEAGIETRLGDLAGMTGPFAEMERRLLRQVNITEVAHDAGPTGVVGFLEFASFYVTGLLVLIGLAPIYSNEYSSGVDRYMLSSKKGRKTLAWIKIGAALLYTFMIVMLWEGLNLAANLWQRGTGGWGLPMQQLFTEIPPYAESPYPLTILEFHFAQLGIHLAGAWAFALLVLLLSSWIKSALITFFTSGMIFLLPFFLAESLGHVAWLQPILTFSFINVTEVQPLFTDFNAVNLFGYPVAYPWAAVGVMVILSILFIALTIRNVKHREVASWRTGGLSSIPFYRPVRI